MGKIILILSAGFADTTRLRLDKEVRDIQQTLRQSNYRDEFRVIPMGAVQIDDLQQTLYDYRPTIVHFSGHGSGENGLILEDNSGRSVLVSEEALARLFQGFQTEVECVLLNACYSEIQAKAIHQHIDCVVGMNQAIGDNAAIKFAVGFYRALGAGEPYNHCFDSGLTLIDLNGIAEVDKPKIKFRPRRTSIVETPKPVSEEVIKPSQSTNHSLSGGDINISSNNNPVAFGIAGRDQNVNQSYTVTTRSNNSNLEAALSALTKLKQNIAQSEGLNPIEKAMVEVPIKTIETELQKPQADQNLIDQAVTMIKKGLDGVETLAEPTMKVAKLLATLSI